jgi:hypothetical protein
MYSYIMSQSLPVSRNISQKTTRSKGPFGRLASLFSAAIGPTFHDPGTRSSQPVKSNQRAGLEIEAIGQPTNSFAANIWFVP